VKALNGVRNAQEARQSGDRQVEQDLIFRSANGLPLKQRNVKREFRRLLQLADIRTIRLYDLRHTAVTLAVAAGVSVKVISEQLGHASISFTLERYSHVLPSIQDEAAARVERMLMGSLSDPSERSPSCTG
jgi:integrase